ncbi:MAG: hypothetical protein A2086_17180 [Spirochaetes bacterium GWD1_27_9]|nr:MAG: hypothetical protein A2Z98_02640 [Spirochaetes bacterium GWB1_27_13]OHD27317.1 MAG: hypothetical protein A2Y34_15965 [Spirochaetes bacterium GWC1_27_15]OHD34179.1 MAG: hypothetical protein A2086_17180 [Spirochaetes bacterium GWD1_27_9]
MQDLIFFIKNKAISLGIDVIGFSSTKKIDDFQKKYYKTTYTPLQYFFPNVKTVIAAGFSYNFLWNQVSKDTAGYIARYTTANFYKILSNKLRLLGQEIKNYLKIQVKDSDFFRIFVNSKINDKLAAFSSGIGSFSKNSLISIDNKGQKFVLGELLLDFELPYFNEEKKETCYNCDICISKCPTNALEDKFIKKEKCLQHLTTQLDIPNNKLFIQHWGQRFYGCTDCIDCCPLNKNFIKTNNENLIGFIGTNFDVTEILSMKKTFYKSTFKNNQLSASWVKEVVLARNGLISIFNQNKYELIKEYIQNLKFFEWDYYEETYLSNFCKLLIEDKI